MTDVAAAMGLVQLARLNELQALRRRAWTAYVAAFTTEEAVGTPSRSPQSEPSLHIYLLRLDLPRLRIARDAFARALHACGVETSVHFMPLHLFSYYGRKYGHHAADFPVALEAHRRMLGIPMHPRLSDEDVQHVASAVLGLANGYRA